MSVLEWRVLSGSQEEEGGSLRGSEIERTGCLPGP